MRSAAGRPTRVSTSSSLTRSRAKQPSSGDNLEVLRAQQDVAAAYAAHHAEARVLLLRLRDRLDAIEAEDDWDTKRKVVETLVTTIRAETIGEDHRKQARRTIGDACAERQALNVVGPGKLAPSRPSARSRTER